MAVSRMNNTLSPEDVNIQEFIEKQRIINDQVINAFGSIRDAIKCIGDIPAVATEPETKSSISRIIDEICIHLDEIRRLVPEHEK
ncbi:MAG: hypothetical protein ACM34K_08130 [Bacillota bacterium]